MSERPDKQLRKEMLAQTKAKARAAERQKLPAADDKLRDYFDMLDRELPRHGCDHTLRLTQNWAAKNDVAESSLLAWLRENGGYCDCEALANVEQKWQDANADVDWN